MTKIARLAGVSAMTVSRVLNNSPSVSPATREKVLRISQALGYSHYPNALSRILRGERSKSIGILTAFGRPHMIGSMIRNIGVELFSSEYVSYIVNTYSDPLVVQGALKTLAERRTEGVIYFAYTANEINSEISQLLRRFDASVLVTHTETERPYHQIYCGWAPGVRDLVRYFAARNCSCPVMLKESANESCVRVFEAACRECRFKKWKVITCQPEELATSPEFRYGLPGDALFCSSEKYRLPVLEMTDGGKQIPVVMLLDDFLISQLRPDYPVLRRREPEAGTLAVKLLLDQINGKADAPPNCFPAHAVYRVS